MKYATLVAAGALLVTATSPALAISRVWISGKGVDQAGCGPIASPCRTLQYAHNLVDAGGEIDVLDGAGYGSLVVTKGVSVINDGAGVAGVLSAAGGAAVTVNAGPTDEVRLKGLAIQGVSTGAVGIQFSSGGVLDLSGVSISAFTTTGINFTPQSGTSALLSIKDSEIFNNGTDNIIIKPSGSTQTRSTIWRTLVGKAVNGITIDNSLNASGFVLLTISDSMIRTMSGNGVVATTANNGMSHIEIDRSTLTLTNSALTASGTGSLIVLQSNAISSNPTVTTVANGGSIRSFGNNAISYYQNTPSLTTVGLQ